MKLLVIDTEDYTLTVQADNVSNAFAKAIVGMMICFMRQHTSFR